MKKTLTSLKSTLFAYRRFVQLRDLAPAVPQDLTLRALETRLQRGLERPRVLSIG
jgi:hypothetical protein